MRMFCQPKNRIYLIFQLLVLIIWGNVTLAQDFSKGKWLKLFVPKEGLNVITYDWLKKNKINPDLINPSTLAIYQNYQHIDDTLHFAIDTSNLKSIKKTPVLGKGLEDGKFDPQDKLYFPVKGLNSIDSDSTFCLIHLNEDEASFANAKAIFIDGIAENFAYQRIKFHEEKYNFLQSGQLWQSEPFYAGETKSIKFITKDHVVGQPSFFQSTFYGSSIQNTQLSVVGAGLTKTISFFAISGEKYDRRADAISSTLKIAIPSGIDYYELTFQFLSKIGSATIGKSYFSYPRLLKGNDNQWYHWPRFISTKNIVKLESAALSSDSQVWLLNENKDFELLKVTNNQFVVEKPNENYVLIADSKLAYEPIVMKEIEPFTNDLQAETQLVIICPKEFVQSAQKFATFKMTQKIKTEVRTLEQILIEYAGGGLSFSGIKSFLYHQKIKKKCNLQYVLFLSDASVDIKQKNNLLSKEKLIPQIPSFQSEESLYPLSSYTSDDYYGILSDYSGTWDVFQQKKYPIDLSIGRIPAKTKIEADIIINKLIQAQSSSPNNQISFVADDEDFNIHILDAEDFSKQIQEKAPQFPLQKTYLDSYSMSISNNTYSSPEMQKKIQSLFNFEAGLIHFIGHGSENGWTDEKIFTSNDIIQLANNQNLPFLLTATCQFAKFDNPYILSGAEALLCSEKGGAQAIIGASRPVFQSTNYLFGKNFYSTLIENLGNQQFRLGDWVRETKNKENLGIGNRNIILLGDPSSPLPWIGQKISIAKNDFTWNKSNNLTIENKFSGNITGTLGIYSDDQPKVTKGTKSPVINFIEPGKLLYQKHISTSTQQTIITIPPMSEKNSKNIHIRFSGDKVQGYQVMNTIKGSSDLIDKEGPAIEQQLKNSLKFIITDSTGIGNLDADGSVSVIKINENTLIPLQSFSKFLQNDKILEIAIDPSLLRTGENTITFQVCDVLQNKTTKNFVIDTNKFESIDCNIYPNPYFDSIKVDFNSTSLWSSFTVEIFIYTLDGKLLKKQTVETTSKTIQLSMVDLPKNQEYILLVLKTDPIKGSQKSYVSKIISNY